MFVLYIFFPKLHSNVTSPTCNSVQNFKRHTHRDCSEWISFHFRTSCTARKEGRSIRVRNTRADRVYGTHRSRAISRVRPIVELFCCTWLGSEWNFPYCRCLSKRREIVKRGDYAKSRHTHTHTHTWSITRVTQRVFLRKLLRHTKLVYFLRDRNFEKKNFATRMCFFNVTSTLSHNIL